MRLLYMMFIVLLLSHVVTAASTDWTDHKKVKLEEKAAKAAKQGKWSLAIKYGEKALTANEALKSEAPEHYLNTLKNLNSYYEKANRLDEIEPRLEKAYTLSKQHLGVAHTTTYVSRNLLYKSLISKEAYERAIPLLREAITTLGTAPYADIKRHHYLKQLYSLYGLTGALENEEKALIEFLALDKSLYGTNDADNIKIIQNLANNYCLQNKIEAFNKITRTHDLRFACPQN
ncbi:hypothetical protein [Kordiimonas pumila]|uniref:Tetratricopeptide repeat protein n=1 Tax=Kordiimonas pumila TaxID=2161677 RepID=A0ABV7D630_9PROT|nr:hypothetical protein [Kordiimonas pumila]